MNQEKLEDIVGESLRERNSILSVEKIYSREEVEKTIYEIAEMLSLKIEISDCEDRFEKYSFSILYF